MATKKDANGDALCQACLDARLAKRRSEFGLQRVANVVDEPKPRTTLTFSPREPTKWSSVRVVRLRGPAEEPATVPTKIEELTRAPKVERAHRDIAPRDIPGASHYAERERRLLELAVEIGFARAHELLDMLKASVRSM